jgi:hypothetical protein
MVQTRDDFSVKVVPLMVHAAAGGMKSNGSTVSIHANFRIAKDVKDVVIVDASLSSTLT